MISTDENLMSLIRLQPGEQITLAARPNPANTWPLYVLTLGLYGSWRKRTVYALTSQRVIARKGIITKQERSLPLVKVQDAAVKTQLWQAFVTLSTAGGSNGVERLGPMSPADAREFCDAVIAASHALQVRAA